MSEMLQARATMTKKMNVMVRKIEGVSSFVLTGKDEHTPDEIDFVVGTTDHSFAPKILTDLNFLIREFLRPSEARKGESEGRTTANYTFDGGLKAQVTICTEDQFPEAEWWVPYLDKNGAVLGFYPPSTRKVSDPTTEKPEDASEFSDDFEDDFDDPSANDPEPVPAPAAAPDPEPAPAAEPETGNEQTDRDLWSYFYGKANIAKHAISGGSVIYACETIGELRTLLIKMICEANGITEDYLHCIDFIPEKHRAVLMKTYPSRLEAGPMISALAAELSIFEALMRNSSR